MHARPSITHLVSGMCTRPAGHQTLLQGGMGAKDLGAAAVGKDKPSWSTLWQLASQVFPSYTSPMLTLCCKIRS